MNVQIYLAKPEDLGNILELQASSFRLLASKDYNARQIESLIKGQKSFRLKSEEITFAAYVNSKLVGFASLSVYTPTIYAVFVHPDFTRLGIGTKLLETIELTAIQKEHRTLYVLSSLSGVHFYQTNGYKITKKSGFWSDNNIWIPCLEMQKQLIPLIKSADDDNADGVIRVATTRVMLDTIVTAFLEGARGEAIKEQYPSLRLSDIYSVIGYYLKNKEEVDVYLLERQRQAAAIRQEAEQRFVPVGIRERLLARRRQHEQSKIVRFLADENFNNQIVRGILLQDSSVEIVRLQDVKLSGADDPTVLEWAAQQGRVILTHDVALMVSFAYERIQTGLLMSGVFEVSRRVPVELAIEEIILIAECSVKGEWEGQVRFLPLQ